MLFSIVRLRARCSRTSCTLRASFSSFSALAVCSLASHLFASKKAVFKTHNQAQLRLCFFLCQAVGKVLTYLCTFRSLSSLSSTCAPCSAFGQRLARDNNSATHARLSRFSAFALRLLVSCCCQAVARCSRTFVRSAPRPRLSRLLPFALWQDTSLQAKKQCSRRTTKAQLRLCFFLCQAVGKVLTYLCTFRSLSSPSSTCAPCFVFGQRLTRDTVPPFAIFNACSAPDYLFVSNTLLVLVFLGSCRLLFGKSPLCKQKSSVQDVQQKHGDLPCFLI